MEDVIEGGGLFATSMLETIGNTPLVKIGNVYAKLETTNPTGSIKDRVAWHLVKKAEAQGELKPGWKIVEVTSGNMGVSLAMISAIRGYRFTAVMPWSPYSMKRKMMEAFGAKIRLTPAKKGMAGAVEFYNKLVKHTGDVWLPHQFENPENIATHREETGREIIHQMKEKIDAFVAGVGTGGTLLGVAIALKQAYPKVKIIAVEPAESRILSAGRPGNHQIDGIGEGFIPRLVQEYRELMTGVVAVESNDAIMMSKYLTRRHGMLVGVSSGANMVAARMLSEKNNEKIVTILPDRGERYL